SESAAKVRESALQLSDMLDNLFSYSDIVSASQEAVKGEVRQPLDLPKAGLRARFQVVLVLVLAMSIAIAVCAETTKRWGDAEMQQEVASYDYQLSNWLTEQKSILGVFRNFIAERPELMEDYASAVALLDSIAGHYPEISVCYMTNPYKEHRVIMNTGWEPDADWKLEKRPWYIGAEEAEGGIHVSAPYYDERTGLYCVTLSQVVYGKNGEFLGIFGIDFYLDKLIRVLGESYGKSGYAFLVDPKGIIVNHPHTPYQLAMDRMTDIFGTEYQEAYTSVQVTSIKDYRGQRMACLAKKDKSSSFTVLVAKPWWDIYGNIVVLGGVLVLLLLLCILAVSAFINRLLRWQQDANRRLQEAADAAMAAGRAKSQFLAQMSHEIRTPINAVLGMNEMILRESSDEEILDYAENIRSAGNTLLTLINSILDFSKIEDGKMEILPARYDTELLIDDLLHMIDEKAKKKGLELRFDIDGSLPRSLFGDDVRIRQIITNLLTNAVKYTQEGSVTLAMKGRGVDDDTLELEVSIADTGIGIRKEDMDKLFQSFQRLDEEKNRNIEGTGLGISIVQKLLAMMGSHLSVESVYGRGSTFSFCLRQKVVDNTPIGSFVESRRRVHDKGKVQYLRVKGARILVVDDNNINLKVMRGLLKRSGIVPDLAESGVQCLAMVKEHAYHIVFLDHMMPGMDGIETLKHLQESGSIRRGEGGTAVVALTANAISGARESYIQAGFDDYLSKPVQGDELEAMVAKYLPEELVSYGTEDEQEQEKEKEPQAAPEKSAGEQDSFLGALEWEEEEEGDPDDVFSQEERSRFEATCPGIDLDMALSYLMNSKSMLLQIMGDFQEDGRAEKIREAYEAENMESYRILVHALKSTSLTVGAKSLSQKARAQESAAKAEDLATVREKHEELMEEYAEIRKGIRAYLEGQK
ncbi:MAG: response regulator, partial [Selenomonadaceae bacterium]|nr:response regulator [Selenomonadaceae bacterium]